MMLPNEVSELYQERMTLLMNNQSDVVTLPQGLKIVVHMIPLKYVDTPLHIDIEQYNFRYWQNHNGAKGYQSLYSIGLVESIWYRNDYEKPHFIGINYIEGVITHLIDKACTRLQAQQICIQHVIIANLLDAKGYKLHPCYNEGVKWKNEDEVEEISENGIQLPQITIYHNPLHTNTLKPMFNPLWESIGFPKGSISYDNGLWEMQEYLNAEYRYHQPIPDIVR